MNANNNKTIIEEEMNKKLIFKDSGEELSGSLAEFTVGQRELCTNVAKFNESIMNFCIELKKLENPKVDKLFEKYEVVILGEVEEEKYEA